MVHGEFGKENVFCYGDKHFLNRREKPISKWGLFQQDCKKIFQLKKYLDVTQPVKRHKGTYDMDILTLDYYYLKSLEVFFK